MNGMIDISAMSFPDFHAELVKNLYNEQWLSDVGYRADDRDGGYRLWIEATGNDFDDNLSDFKRAVYREVPKPRIMNAYLNVQLSLF